MHAIYKLFVLPLKIMTPGGTGHVHKLEVSAVWKETAQHLCFSSNRMVVHAVS